MSDKENKDTTKANQIEDWLKKLERESWQLELLVSAFTIFLLIQADIAFSDTLQEFQFKYDRNQNLLGFVWIFAGLLGICIRALAAFLILHLMLRGFWIGAIGLRSVQSNIDFEGLNYSSYFTKKLQKKVMTLDSLVILLDEICSVIFSFSFLVISILISFGTYILFLGLITLIFNTIGGLVEGMAWLEEGAMVLAWTFILLTVISGILYMLDYFTLGFFKKYNWLSRLYYPIYRFYGVITFSGISRSIYYYLISKFSKFKIRLAYLVALVLFVFTWITEFDQLQYFPSSYDETHMDNNFYDNLRSIDEYVEKVSVTSHEVDKNFLSLFIRYQASDNKAARSICPDFVPQKKEGWNTTMKFKFSSKGLQIRSQKFEKEDNAALLECLSGAFEISINNSIYSDLKFHFQEHPNKKQKGIFTMIPTTKLNEGHNELKVRRLEEVDEDNFEFQEFAYVPLWKLN